MTTLPSANAFPNPARERRLTSLLIVTGVVLLGLFGLLIVLYTNVPVGYGVPFGLSLSSVPLFARVWHYPSVSLSPHMFSALATFVFVALWTVYALAAAILQLCHCETERRNAKRVIIAFAFLFTVLLVLVMPPIFSSDVYLYATFGRMVATYSLNPYVTTAQAIASDNLFPHLYWTGVTSYYGPAWTLMSALTSRLAGHSVLATIIAFKALPGAFHLVNCILVYMLGRRVTGRDGIAALLLYAWNPLILLETVGSGHNEAVMMAFALAGLLLITNGKLLGGVALLVVSILVKYLTAVLLLLVGVVALARQKTLAAALGLAGRMILVALSVAVPFYLPFLAGVHSLGQLVGGGAPLAPVVVNPLRQIMLHLAAHFMDRGQPPVEMLALATSYLSLGLNLVFVLIVAAALVHLLRNRASWPQVITVWGILSFVYIVFIYGGGFPWYMVSLLPIFLVGSDRKSNRLLFFACACIGGILMLLGYAILIPVG